MNNYEVAEIVEIGKAQDVILGSTKFVPNEDDGIGVPRRETLEEEDE
jgi:hypothetical protein